MATVHRAKELGIEGFERWVALKRLLPHLAEDESFVRSFVREAKLASLLAHPNIVQIYELGRVGTVYFISMELIDGYDIRQILRQSRRVTGPPPIDVTLAILIQICDALEYAHSRVDDRGHPLGLVHRDVSPSNVIVGHSGHLKIIDFGIAKAQIQQLQTNTGRVKGKMAYMSPEAIRGNSLDGRSDIFSLGVLAHELLTARPLFASKNDYKTLQRVQNATVAPPSTFNRDCPPELDAIVLRALERNIDRRWQTAGEMQLELVRLRHQYQLTAQPREVADWLRSAFAVPAPISSKNSSSMHRAPSQIPVETPQPESNPSIVIEPEQHLNVLTPATGPAKIPVGGIALPTAEEDDEIIEIAWGGRSRNEAVVLEEVPDVSSRGMAAAGATPTPGLATPTSEKRGTLIGPAPPPPEKLKSPRSWATGTKPPLVADDDDLDLDRFPLATSEDETPVEQEQPRSMPVPRPRRTTSAVPRVTFRSPTTGSTPVPITSDPIAAPVTPTTGINFRTHTTDYGRGATSIGGAIVERERRRRLTVALSVLAIAAVGVGAFYLLRGVGGETAATAAEPARSTVKLVVEPAGAKVEIAGAGSFDGSPATTQLLPGSYPVKVTSDGHKTWEATLEVAEGESQTLHIVLAAAESDETSELVDRTASAASDQPDATVPGERKRRRRSDEPARPILETPDQPVAAANEFTGPLGVSTPMALPSSEPPPAIEKPAQPTGPVVVPPTAVKKVRGDVPRLRVRGDLPSRISAQLCIDRRGDVESVRLLSKVPDEAAEELEKALRRWRYQPYRDAGQRVAVCFAVNFRAR